MHSLQPRQHQDVPVPAAALQTASKFPKGTSHVLISTALSSKWNLVPGVDTSFQIEMDGALKQQAPAPWTAPLLQVNLGMRTFLPAEASAWIAGKFCCGWRRLQDETLVLVMSTKTCPNLRVVQCLVGDKRYQSLVMCLHHQTLWLFSAAWEVPNDFVIAAHNLKLSDQHLESGSGSSSCHL